MRTPLSDDFVLTVKDQLRTVRYKIRRGARSQAARVDPLPPAPVAVATDAVFSHVEAAAAAFLPQDEVALYAYPFPQPASAYFSLDPALAHDLTPKIYSALKALLSQFGSEVFLISEHAVHEACESVLASEARTIVAVLDPRLAGDRFGACVKLCAALALALATAQPVRELMPVAQKRRGSPGNSFVAPNEYCAFVIGLAIALCSRPDVDLADPKGLAEAADLAVHARFRELSDALKRKQPGAALAAEFNSMLLFLP